MGLRTFGRNLAIFCLLNLAHAQSPGTTIWSAGMEGGDLTEWTLNGGGNQANSGCPGVGGLFSVASQDRAHSGTWSDKLSITTPATCTSKSSGARMFRWKEPRANRDAYYDVYYYIPTYYTLSGNNHFIMPMQFKSRTGTRIDPIWAFYLDDPSAGTYRMMMGWGFGGTILAGPRAGNMVSGKDFKQGSPNSCDSGGCSAINFPVNQWVHMQAFLHEDDATCGGSSTVVNYHGHLTVWQDGTKVFDFANIATGYNSNVYNTWCVENEWSVNIYSDGLTPNLATVYIDDASIRLPSSAIPAPEVTLSPTSLSFASQIVGTTSSAQAITLTNTGTASLTIASISVTGTNASNFSESDACPGSLAVSNSCTLSVTFTPSATGLRTAAITVTDNAAGSPHTISLTGTGVTFAPVASLNPTSIAFGNQILNTTSSVHTVTLTNTGTATLSITNIVIDGTNASDFAETHTCGSSLAASASCTFDVTFTPLVSGALAGALSISDNAAGSPHSVSLSGTGTVSGPVVALSRNSVAFGDQLQSTTSGTQTVTLSNTGTSTLNLTSITVTGANLADFGESDDCGASVLAGNNCTISLSFTPSALGARTAAVHITDDAPGSPQAINLTGNGVSIAPMNHVSLSGTINLIP